MLILLLHLNNELGWKRYMEYFNIAGNKAEIIGYYGTRSKLTVLSDIVEPPELLGSILLIIAYLNDLH